MTLGSIDLSLPKTWIPLVVVLVGGGAAGGWLLFGSSDGRPPSTLPPELSVDALKTQVTSDPTKIREAFQRQDLTEEQRRELGQNMREVMRGEIDKRVSEYFDAATDQEKEAVLDKHLDELAERAKEWEKQREEWRKEFEKRREEESRNAPTKEGADAPRPERQGFGSRSTEERKSMSENRSADEMARNMAYFSALRQRAETRGIKVPFVGGGPGGPGGSGGPWGGGPGGPGRGPGGGSSGGSGRGPAEGGRSPSP